MCNSETFFNWTKNSVKTMWWENYVTKDRGTSFAFHNYMEKFKSSGCENLPLLQRIHECKPHSVAIGFGDGKPCHDFSFQMKHSVLATGFSGASG